MFWLLKNKFARDGGEEEGYVAASRPQRAFLPFVARIGRATVAVAIGAAVVGGALLGHELGYGSQISILLLLAFAASIALRRYQMRQSAASFGALSMKFAVALLGLQFSASHLIGVGFAGFIALMGVMVAAMVGGLLGARLSAAPNSIGILMGGATAICGLSAAAVIYAVLGPKRIGEREYIGAVIGILVASSATVFVNAMIVDRFGLTGIQTAFLFGSTVHDAAQAIGAAYKYGDTVGTQATILKTARIAMLVPFAVVLTSVIGPRTSHTRLRISSLIPPAYLSGFVVLATMSSLGLVPDVIADYGGSAAKLLLLFAIAMTILGLNVTHYSSRSWKGIGAVCAGASIFGLIAATALLQFL